MTEEEILARAYFVMGIDAGASMESITTRYKRLAMVWHSDRFPQERKQEAEEEMKKINNARDELKNHFANNHKTSGYCACRPGATADKPRERTGTGQAPGPGKRRTTQENNTEEAEARRRNEERARRMDEEAAAATEKQAAATAQRATTEESVKDALEQAKLANDEKLRWKVSICMIIAWVGLNTFGAFSMNAKSWWHDASWKWERDHPATPYVAPTPVPEQPRYEAPSSNNIAPPPGETNFSAPPAQPSTYTPPSTFTPAPSNTPSLSQPWKPNYLQNPNSGTQFNPLSPAQPANPYINTR